LTYEKNRNNKVDIKFKIMGYSEKDKSILLFDRFITDSNISVINNQNVSGIILDIGDVKTY